MKAITNTGSGETTGHTLLPSGNDTLEVLLPEIVDGNIYDQLRGEIDLHAPGGVNNILFDCSGVAGISTTALISLIDLEKYAGRCGMRIVMLDAPAAIFDELAPLLQNADWADSRGQHHAHMAPSLLCH